jgi:hypothetical protein
VLINQLLISAGWAENASYGDAFDPYRTELASAAADAAANGLGVWRACGSFGVASGEIGAAPTQPLAVQPTRSDPLGLAGDCDPNYTPCVPNVTRDLDCPEIGYMTVQVIGYDRHGFDRDNNGWGCE